MDKTGKKKGGNKADFDNAIKGNEAIRSMRFHYMTFDELEDNLETSINESKPLLQRLILVVLKIQKI